jgi:hypothetical protein
MSFRLNKWLGVIQISDGGAHPESVWNPSHSVCDVLISEKSRRR